MKKTLAIPQRGVVLVGLSKQQFLTHEDASRWEPEMRKYAGMHGLVVCSNSKQVLVQFFADKAFFYPTAAYQQWGHNLQIEVFSPDNKKVGEIKADDWCIGIGRSEFVGYTNEETLKWQAAAADHVGKIGRVLISMANNIWLQFADGSCLHYPAAAYKK